MSSRKRELSTLILQFEVHNRPEGKSHEAIDWYNEALGLFHRWLQEEGMSCLMGVWERKRPGSSCSMSRPRRATGVSLPETR